MPISLQLPTVRSARISRRIQTAASKTQRKQTGGGFGKSKSPQKDKAGTSTEAPQPTIPAEDNTANTDSSLAPRSATSTTNSSPPSSTSNSTDTANNVAALPAFSRNEILATCTQTSALIAVFGYGLRTLAPLIITATHSNDIEVTANLLNWLNTPSIEDAGIAAGVALTVTAARVALLATWPAFKQASDASNQQVLAPLTGPTDLAVVSVLPGVAEELLFRGALIPTVCPDWRGAVISGVVFGALHVNGGRNTAFAVWASAVGAVYGGAFLYTGNIWVPVIAHSVANLAASSVYTSAVKK